MDNQLKIIFDEMLDTTDSVDEIIKRKSFDTPIMDEGTLDKVIQEVIAEFPQQVAEFRSGKEALIAFFIGQVMKKT